MRSKVSSRLMIGLVAHVALVGMLISAGPLLAAPQGYGRDDVFNPYADSGYAQQDDAESGSLSDETAAAMKHVIQTLKHAALAEEPEIRMAALRTLPRFVSHDDAIIDLLWNAAKSDNADIKRTAAWALVCCDESTGKFIDGLLQLAGDEALDQQIRDNVVERLKYIGPAAVVPRAMDAVQSGTLSTQLQAVKMLVEFEENSQPAIELLLQTGMNGEADVKVRAVSLSAAGRIMEKVAAYERARHRFREKAMSAAQVYLDEYDTDGNGSIDVDGTDRALASSIDPAKYDTNKDGAFSHEELTEFFVDFFKHENAGGYNSTSTAYPAPPSYNASKYATPEKKLPNADVPPPSPATGNDGDNDATGGDDD